MEGKLSCYPATMRTMKWSAAIAVGLLLTLDGAAFWGANGHRIVGLIAERRLTEEALEGVREILGTESLARASTWADEIRSDSRWGFAAPWHYINIDDGQTFDSAPRDQDGDILQALGCFEQVLRDPAAARPDKRVAIRFLTHLVGDLHQPLHVGLSSDRGGNSVQVQFFGELTNLHSLWDSGLIEGERLSYSEFADFIDHPNPQAVARLQSGTFREWAQESFQLRSKAYHYGDSNSNTNLPRLGYRYAFVNMPTVRMRLLQAGIRLAGVFNSIFDSDGASPSSWSHPGDRAVSKIQCDDLGTRLGAD